MRLDVRYREGEPTKITSAGDGQCAMYIFTIEGRTARLVDVRPDGYIEAGEPALELIELNLVHDAILELAFIDRVTVWMKGRTDTEPEKPVDELEGGES